MMNGAFVQHREVSVTSEVDDRWVFGKHLAQFCIPVNVGAVNRVFRIVVRRYENGFVRAVFHGVGNFSVQPFQHSGVTVALFAAVGRNADKMVAVHDIMRIRSAAEISFEHESLFPTRSKRGEVVVVAHDYLQQRGICSEYEFERVLETVICVKVGYIADVSRKYYHIAAVIFQRLQRSYQVALKSAVVFPRKRRKLAVGYDSDYKRIFRGNRSVIAIYFHIITF